VGRPASAAAVPAVPSWGGWCVTTPVSAGVASRTSRGRRPALTLATVADGSSPVRRGEESKSFGHHLRELREAAGESRAGPARRAGVPASTLRNWEGDRGFPGVQAGLRLAAAQGVTLERLAEGVETLLRRTSRRRRR
jgi:hypothetical protein